MRLRRFRGLGIFGYLENVRKRRYSLFKMAFLHWVSLNYKNHFRKLDLELRAAGIHAENIDGSQLLTLQADAAALRERFGHRYLTDFLGEASLTLEINSPYPSSYWGPCYRDPNRKYITDDHFRWAKCEVCAVCSVR